MIITIKDNIPDDVALSLVMSVVKEGKVSKDSKGNKFYCWFTTLTYKGIQYDVETYNNKNQPSFIVARHITHIN